MTGSPNQQNHSNVFGQDFNYPTSNTDWNRFTTGCYSQENFPFISNYGSAPVTFPMGLSNSNNFLYNYQVDPFTDCHQQTNVLPSNTDVTDNLPSSSVTTNCTSNSQWRIMKRRRNSPERPAVKQHITEEKMAEHMSKLYISSQTPSEEETDETRLKRLFMCKEMLKLQTESILPASLIKQRPCTALMLWTPPQKIMPDINEENESDNNNDERALDNNLMDMDSR